MSKKTIITKTYKCVRYTDLQADIKMPDGSIMEVRFSGGVRSPKLVTGVFTTTDQQLQEAIENAPGFGKKYVLHRKYVREAAPVGPKQPRVNQFAPGTPITGPEPRGPQPPPRRDDTVEFSGPQPTMPDYGEDSNDDLADVPAKTTSEDDDMAGGIPDNDAVVVEEVTSGQKARNYLKDLDGVSLNMLRNNADIRKVAKEYNVQFPNWPQ